MREETPNQSIEETPTLTELTDALTGAADFAHTEDGKWATTRKRVLRCGVCNAPSGQVTLMKIPFEFKDEAREKGIVGDYVCLGLDCRKQRDQAVNRLVKKVYQSRGKK